MSGIVWPFIKGKNGYIYKIVDLVNTRDRTLVTTYHEIMGQQSCMVAPWTLFEIVKEGAGSVPSEDDSPDSGDGEASRSGSDGDNESVITVIYRGHDEENGGEGEEGTQMAERRRATIGQIDGGRARRESLWTSGGYRRRVVSDLAMVAPAYTRREGNDYLRPNGANLRGSNSHAMDNLENADAAISGESEAETGNIGRSRSYSTASTASYRGLWGLLQGFRGKMDDQDIEIENEESPKNSSETGESMSSAEASLGHFSMGDRFVQEWRAVERRRAGDEDDLSFECRFRREWT
ncbi:hypothetical protein BLS_006466 [Venturia inaequalis]|uniref:Uncharacterized protein n=1 Tax=Venturia inaequalis TaxID=5025 RepID=A0A8H3YND4_VENIN|nr:hypothetical protein BLS_006466 [Venturia inaequalis]